MRLINYAVVVSSILLALSSAQQVAAKDNYNEQVKFPPLDKAFATNYIDNRPGYVSKANLAQIVPGIKKREVYSLIGTPHYSEGMFAGRWNYVLRVFSPQARAYITCQYQIKFGGGHVDATYWNSQTCYQLSR
jgi:OmpA-OmpF porin, OOP family